MELGATLHSALKDTGYFPKYMINMIQLGEETGRLEEVLNSLSKYYNREDEIASGIKSAVTYPLVLSAVMIARYCRNDCQGFTCILTDICRAWK